jgi:hypothetical protein
MNYENAGPACPAFSYLRSASMNQNQLFAGQVDDDLADHASFRFF